MMTPFNAALIAINTGALRVYLDDLVEELRATPRADTADIVNHVGRQLRKLCVADIAPTGDGNPVAYVIATAAINAINWSDLAYVALLGRGRAAYRAGKPEPDNSIESEGWGRESRVGN